MVDLFHNLPGKSRIGHIYSVIFLLVGCPIFLIAAAAYGAESASPTSSTSHRSFARFGILNTLHGVNIDDARVALEMNINRQSTIGIEKVMPKLEIIPDVATAADRIRQKQLYGLNLTGIDYILLREMVVAEPLYVALSNATDAPAVVAHPDPGAANITTWTEWAIPLQEFADKGINLTNVDKIAIGLGSTGGAAAGGSGKMYFDDIRLYRP